MIAKALGVLKSSLVEQMPHAARWQDRPSRSEGSKLQLPALQTLYAMSTHETCLHEALTRSARASACTLECRFPTASVQCNFQPMWLGLRRTHAWDQMRVKLVVV